MSRQPARSRSTALATRSHRTSRVKIPSRNVPSRTSPLHLDGSRNRRQITPLPSRRVPLCPSLFRHPRRALNPRPRLFIRSQKLHSRPVYIARNLPKSEPSPPHTSLQSRARQLRRLPRRKPRLPSASLSSTNFSKTLWKIRRSTLHRT